MSWRRERLSELTVPACAYVQYQSSPGLTFERQKELLLLQFEQERIRVEMEWQNEAEKVWQETDQGWKAFK